MSPVGFHARMKAFLIDLGVFLLVAHGLAALDFGLNVGTNVNNFGTISLGGGVLFLVGYTMLEVVAGGTLGKKWTGLGIAAEDGTPATRKMLAMRWWLKSFPIVVLAPAFGLFVFCYGTPQWRAPSYIMEGLKALAWGDALIGTLLTVYVIVGCFRAARPGGRAFHDRMAGTGVFRVEDLRAGSSFEPVIGRRVVELVEGEVR